MVLVNAFSAGFVANRSKYMILMPALAWPREVKLVRQAVTSK